ncbi:50S ribosomal protein L9 [bacterium]|nr:50S ribosomal protein L9 [bacterium]MBU2599945.1 50S ribosomal protein L9 [bacterium]
MKVLLIQDVKSLGQAGDTKEVSEGYARNFLIPQKMAILATSANIKNAEIKKSKIRHDEEKKKKDLLLLAEKLNHTSITIKRQTGENEKLFGSVTNIDIAEALQGENIPINKKAVLLKEPIKTLGVFDTSISLASDIKAQIKVWVVKE